MTGEQLKSLRKLSGLTQVKLGLLMGFKTQINASGTETCNYIHLLESGVRNISEEMAGRLCNCFGFSGFSNNSLLLSRLEIESKEIDIGLVCGQLSFEGETKFFIKLDEYIEFKQNEIS